MQSKTENRLELEFFPSQLIIKSSKWYDLEKMMPWKEIEESLSDLFSDHGRHSIPVRQIIGALIIQADKALSDRDTLITIMETPMLQYFLGLDDYIKKPLFDFTLLCKYRKLIGIDIAKDMIDLLLKHHKIIGQKPEENISHKGSLSIDATAVPVNITYPTDLKLLNKVREKTEEIIDECHKTSKETIKPRTYRLEARSEYLKYAKAKRLSKNKRRTSIRKQLQYVRRNIETIESRIASSVYVLKEDHIESLNICKIIYDQQKTMWENKTHKIDNRLVSLSQAHIRCIVRGKTARPYEFGPKIAVSKVNGFIHIDRISFDNFNESKTLKDIVEKYKENHGVYPVSIRADKIYQTRDNKKYCHELKIRLSGKPLGRPRKDGQGIQEVLRKEDFVKRIEIEGVFGVAKTKYGLAKLMTKLPQTQIASIGLVFFVMNLRQIHSFTSFYESYETYIFPIYGNETCHIFEDEPSFL